MRDGTKSSSIASKNTDGSQALCGHGRPAKRCRFAEHPKCWRLAGRPPRGTYSCYSCRPRAAVPTTPRTPAAPAPLAGVWPLPGTVRRAWVAKWGGCPCIARAPVGAAGGGLAGSGLGVRARSVTVPVFPTPTVLATWAVVATRAEGVSATWATGAPAPATLTGCLAAGREPEEPPHPVRPTPTHRAAADAAARRLVMVRR